MPRLWAADGSECMISDYLRCEKSKSKHRTYRLVCETICKYNKKCKSFKNYKLKRPEIYPPEPERKVRREKNRRRS